MTMVNMFSTNIQLKLNSCWDFLFKNLSVRWGKKRKIYSNFVLLLFFVGAQQKVLIVYRN